MARAGIGFPVVVKPDIGCNGTGVRLVADAAALAAVLAQFPRDVGLVLQAQVPHEGEAGLFYVRRPGEARGRVTSVTLKFAPYVDRRRPLDAARADRWRTRAPAACRSFICRVSSGRLEEVPPLGEHVRLVFSGNHCKGSIFRNGTAEVTPGADRRASNASPARCRISISAGSTCAIAAWRRCAGARVSASSRSTASAPRRPMSGTRDTSLREAYAAQFFHYGAAFEIGRAMRARGHRPSGLRAMCRLWRRQKRLMASLSDERLRKQVRDHAHAAEAAGPLHGPACRRSSSRILQGATELFPVSSLGHAVVLPALLRWNIDQHAAAFLPFLVMLHLGTATALLLYFWRDWWALLLGVLGPAASRRIARERGACFLPDRDRHHPRRDHRLRAGKVLPRLFGTPLVAAAFLVVNGVLLLAGERLRRRGERPRACHPDASSDALTIGLWQCTALIPGISRSGATIVGGLLRGIDHEGVGAFLVPDRDPDHPRRDRAGSAETAARERAARRVRAGGDRGGGRRRDRFLPAPPS